MSDPYLGEIRMFAGTFAPVDWALCDGQTLSVSQYEALYALIGTRYGGDGQQTFKLPDLRGRIPIAQGQAPGHDAYLLGQSGGVEEVVLNSSQLPQHSHAVAAQAKPGKVAKADLWAASRNRYFKGEANASMNPATVAEAGTLAPQPHSNMGPYLAVHFIICLNGLWPDRA